MISLFRKSIGGMVLLGVVCGTAAAAGEGYKNLSIAVYFRYQETQSTPNNMNQFATQWANVEAQVHVDKVYLETTRNDGGKAGCVY